MDVIPPNIEYTMKTSGDIVYYWWCQACQCSHSEPYCPNTAITEYDCYRFIYPYGYYYYDPCPCCGQPIRREV